MPNYAELYHLLCNAITDALEMMESGNLEYKAKIPPTPSTGFSLW